MKKSKKLFVSSMLSLCLAMLLAVSVSAGPSIDGSLSGYKVSGSITMGSSSATGYTSTHAPNGIVTVSVSYTYAWGLSTDFFTITGGNSSGNSGISFTANARHVNPKSINASGFHTVSAVGQYWSGPTSTP